MDTKQAKQEIREMAKDVIQQTGNLNEQKELLWDKIRPKKKLIEVLAHIAFKTLYMEFLYAARTGVKRGIINGDSDRAPNEPRVSADVALSARSMLDSLLCGDKPIGDCTREEIEQQAIWHANQAGSHTVRAKIFADAAKKVKVGKLARACITEKQLERIVYSAKGDFGQTPAAKHERQAAYAN